MQKSPSEVKVEAIHTQHNIEQWFYEVADNGQRLAALVALLAHYQPASCVIFCNTRQQCQDIADTLHSRGFHAQALHGDLDQRDRDQVLVRFANRSCSVLVATDVAARGLDITGLAAVINLDVAPALEMHVYRIGRTGRVGESGLALSLASLDEMGAVGRIEQLQGGESKW